MHEKNVLWMHYIVFNNISALESGNIASNTNSNARPTPTILFGWETTRHCFRSAGRKPSQTFPSYSSRGQQRELKCNGKVSEFLRNKQNY